VNENTPDRERTGNNTCLLLRTNQLQQVTDCGDNTRQIPVTAQVHI